MIRVKDKGYAVYAELLEMYVCIVELNKSKKEVEYIYIVIDVGYLIWWGSCAAWHFAGNLTMWLCQLS